MYDVTCSQVADVMPLRPETVNNKVLAVLEILIKVSAATTTNMRKTLDYVKLTGTATNTIVAMVKRKQNILMDRSISLMPQAYFQECFFREPSFLENPVSH